MNEPLIRPTSLPQADAPPESHGGPDNPVPPNSQPSAAAQPEADARRPPRFPLIALWVIACLVTQVALPGRLRLDDRELLLTPMWLGQIWSGTMWGGWAGCVWISSAWSNRRWLWVILLGGAALWHVHWMSQTTQHAPQRYAVSLCAYGVAQAILFRLLGVARWRASPLRVAETAPRRSQFGIADLIGLTATVALLITAASGYQPPLGKVYWWGLVVAEVLLVGIGTLAVLAALGQGRPQRRWWRIATVASLVAAAGILDWLETGAAAGRPRERSWFLYAILLLTCWTWLSTLAAAGRTASEMEAGEES